MCVAEEKADTLRKYTEMNGQLKNLKKDYLQVNAEMTEVKKESESQVKHEQTMLMEVRERCMVPFEAHPAKVAG